MVSVCFARVARYLGAFAPRHDRIQTYFRPTQTRRFQEKATMYGRFKHWNETHGGDEKSKPSAPVAASKGAAKGPAQQSQQTSGGMDFDMSVEQMFQKLRDAPPEKCHSLVAKHLTADVFEKLKNTTTSLGGTLAHCINTGAVNLDSGVGCMACDPEGYEVFDALLDNIIKDYHKFPMDQEIKHPAAEFGDLDNLPFGDLDPEGQFVVSTRVRVGRSADGFPFPPSIDAKQRKAIEDKAKVAFNSLPGDLGGKYYSLETMSAEDESQLIEDHFLFTNDDRFNEAAGVYRDWPKSRGIFHNANKTFLSWLNEEDHFRFISMQKGGNLGEVYRRLVTGMNHMEKAIKFAHSGKVGFITFCPTNLGTAMRASVHARFDCVANTPGRKDPSKTLLAEMCAEYNLQPRGVHGEHSASIGGIYDISNKRRLGLTELQAATEMANGVSALIEEERKLRKQQKGQEFKMSVDEMFQKLQSATPEQCHSLVQKYLTPDVFNELKDKKTELGGTLAHCINTGAVNIDSGVGVMAVDTEAYEVFAPLLDNVIKDYHRFPMDQEINHPAPDFGDVDNLPFGDLDPECLFVISTRVRVGRSVEGIPLPPLLSKADRQFIEVLAKQGFKKLPGDYKGTYYSLETMTPEEEQQLISDHFLFKNDDRFNEEAGVYRDWPMSRGIFHNPQKNFLVWLNEEDHLRIISMQMGGNLGEVYSRLVKGIQYMGQEVPFAHSDRFGYLTFCPTNLGTTMRASVHVRIPLTSRAPAKDDTSKQSRMHELCDKYNLQPRGIHGEHTESVGGIYDISNKRRLGLTEIQAATEMANGVKAIIEEERSLRDLNKGMDMDLTVEDMFQKLQSATPDQCHSLVQKYLTPDVFNELKDKKTKLGGTLAHCINTGAVNIDSGVGCMAVDPEGYEVFAPLLDNVIKDYHKFPMDQPINHPAADFGNVTKLPFGNLDETPGAENMIVSSRIRVGRSVRNMPFPPLISDDDREYIEILAKQGFKSLPGDYKGTYYSLETMTPEEEQQLISDHFLFKNDDRFNEAAGVYRSWPKSRGIFHNPKKNFLVWLNEEDHLRIISMQMGGNLGEVYSRLVTGINHMEKKVPFAHSDRFGYLTFCPTNLGTTLRASVHMKIPNLEAAGTIKDVCAKHNIQPRGIHGEHTESVGSVYDLSNKRRLGLTEIEAVTEMANGVKAIIEEELRLGSGQQTKQ